MKRITFLFLALAASLSAQAAPKGIQLTVNQEVRLYSAIHDGLAGAQTITKVNGVDSAVLLPYTLSAATRFTLADDLALLQPQVEAAQRMPGELLHQLDPSGKGIPNTDPRAAEYVKQLNELGDRVESLPLEQISKSDLNLDSNNISPAVLADLRPILKP
jgi:hypothetical protein